MPESTPEEHEKAKKLPYRELVGSLMYPAVMSKLEIRFAVSQLARFMTNWTEEHWKCALMTLKYGITTRYFGVIFSRGLDKHGVNVLYAYADSSFTAPYSHGGHTLMMNGGAVISTSKKHPTIDISPQLQTQPKIHVMGESFGIRFQARKLVQRKILQFSSVKALFVSCRQSIINRFCQIQLIFFHC